jgi:hypothetical protein
MSETGAIQYIGWIQSLQAMQNLVDPHERSDDHPHHVWFNKKDDASQYELPNQHHICREAEKVLISMVYMYIPLQHLLKGQLGCHGHVCCFCQDIEYLEI